MLAQLKEICRPLEELMSPIEEANRRVWEGQITLATTAHLLGGVGIGLLAFPKVRDRAQPIAYALMSVSFLMHLYAFVTPWPTSTKAAARERLSA